METHSANTTVTVPYSGPPADQTSTAPTSRAMAKSSSRGKSRTGGNKRPRFVPGQGNDDVVYSKHVLPLSLSIAPCKTYFTIYTSSNDIPSFCDVVYQCMCSRVRTLPQVISLPMFKYVVAIAWYSRLVGISVTTGVRFTLDNSEIIKVGTSIPLPHFVCKYIESLGIHTLASNAQVIPYCADYREMIPLASEWYYDPLEAIEEAGRPWPNTQWSLDKEWISEYIQSVTRLFRSGIDVRTITKEVTGTPELLVGYQPIVGERTPTTCERLSVTSAQLGAAFGFRDYSTVNDWPFGDNWILPPCFRGEPIDPIFILSDAMSKSIGPRVV